MIAACISAEDVLCEIYLIQSCANGGTFSRLTRIGGGFANLHTIPYMARS